MAAFGHEILASSQAEASYNLNEVVAAEREANIGAVSPDDLAGDKNQSF